MQIQSAWEIYQWVRFPPPLPPPPHPALQLLARLSMSSASVPMVNFTCPQQEQAPHVNPVATSACGARMTPIYPHTRIAFRYCPSASRFCSVSLVTSSTLQMACRATFSSVSRNTALPSLVVCVATQRRDGSEIFRNQCILHQETWNIRSSFVHKGE